MSRAFVKESEDEWLGNQSPTLAALERFLTREQGSSVYEVSKAFDELEGRDVHTMSNGSKYALDDDNRWYAV